MASELKKEFFQRTLTAILISIIVITLVLYSSDFILKTLISLLSLALLLEWMKVLQSSLRKKLIFLILFTILITAIQLIGALFEPISFVVMLGITVWIVIAYQIFFK